MAIVTYETIICDNCGSSGDEVVGSGSESSICAAKLHDLCDNCISKVYSTVWSSDAGKEFLKTRQPNQRLPREWIKCPACEGSEWSKKLAASLKAEKEKSTLFQSGDFTLNSGAKSTWKIECDALTEGDWEGLAQLVRQTVVPFCAVYGVPRGGMSLAKALSQYETGDKQNPVLIVDDVWTTGGSWRRYRDKLIEVWDPHSSRPIALLKSYYIGVVVFARGEVTEPGVVALFQMPKQLWLPTAGVGA